MPFAIAHPPGMIPSQHIWGYEVIKTEFVDVIAHDSETNPEYYSPHKQRPPVMVKCQYCGVKTTKQTGNCPTCAAPL